MSTIIIPQFRNRDYFNGQRFFLTRSRGGIREIKAEHNAGGTLVCCKELDDKFIAHLPNDSPFILRMDEVLFMRSVLEKYKGQKDILGTLIALNAIGDIAATIILQHLLLLTDELGNQLVLRRDHLETFVKELMELRT